MRIYRLNLTPKAAQEIIAALKIKLSASEKMRIAAGGTKNVDAHDFFLKGRELVTGNKRDREMFVDATNSDRPARIEQMMHDHQP